MATGLIAAGTLPFDKEWAQWSSLPSQLMGLNMVEEIWLPLIDKQQCTGCGDCIMICPTKALDLVDGLAVVAEPAACNYCGQCEAICPVGAIALPYQIIS